MHDIGVCVMVRVYEAENICVRRLGLNREKVRGFEEMTGRVFLNKNLNLNSLVCIFNRRPEIVICLEGFLERRMFV